ncbi:MAG: M16 family metallopeptidase [Labrys sp. (in: a-proteobacteria)]
MPSLTPASPAAPTSAVAPHARHARLANGLEVVVIPDHRAPVVTHMIWYRVGAADEPKGKSGIAHFLEHLMFKGTARNPGGFSKQVSDLGGQENAFTGHDYTAYFQRVAKEHLATMMAFEADRMTGLVLSDEVVDPERNVVLEERKMRVDNDPGSQLGEEVASALFVHHPYGTPIIGWEDEIESLHRTDALAFYSRFYTPNNAILVVAGDVEADAVLKLAEETYGKVPARAEIDQRRRPQEPPQRADRRIELADKRVEQPSIQRHWRVPSYGKGEPGEGDALEVLSHILGGGQTSRLYRTLVVDRKLATGAGCWYGGTAVDDARFVIYASPRPGVAFSDIETAIDEILETVARDGIDAADIARAKTRLIADAVFAQDSQASLARQFGSALAVGLTVDDVQSWPAQIDAVTGEAVQAACRRRLVEAHAVTGILKGAA